MLRSILRAPIRLSRSIRPFSINNKREDVLRTIKAKGCMFRESIVTSEVNYFFDTLGLNPLYFDNFSSDDISRHIVSFIAAKHSATLSNREIDNIQFSMEQEHGATFICPALMEHDREVQLRIEEYIRTSSRPEYGWTVRYFRSTGPCIEDGTVHLSMYFVTWNKFVNPSPAPSETSLQALCVEKFIEGVPTHVVTRYRNILQRACSTVRPVVDTYATTPAGTTAVQCCFPASLPECLLSTMATLTDAQQLKVDRLFIETFSNGTAIYTLYIENVPSQAVMDDLIANIMSLTAIRPDRGPLSTLFTSEVLTARKVTYAEHAAAFAHYFTNLNQFQDVYDQLLREFPNDEVNRGRVMGLKAKLKRESLSQARVFASILDYIPIFMQIYADFHSHLRGDSPVGEVSQPLKKLINTSVTNELDKKILKSFLVFNASILRSNFNVTSKSAVAYRLDPGFLEAANLPTMPYGLYLVIGSTFRGFHVRFKEIARGGIRVIRSPNQARYNQNARTLFDETYALAYTQQLKNKDIPEGGSKGTILLDVAVSTTQAQHACAMKYVDALLDLMLATDPGVSNRYNKRELLFLGPDENTSDLMGPACVRARQRGYQYWRAFTSSKPPELGGISHINVGATTASVRTYQEGIIEKLGLDETQVTKVQTGGPDGDLGSNEILRSKDKTIAIVDVSGVLYDPEGLDREELVRLAKARIPITNFNMNLLSSNGYHVGINDHGKVLPNGHRVTDGMNFRDKFVLNPTVTADFLVPCGGRPDTININNVDWLLPSQDGKKKLKYKFLVEGANLYVSQDAREALEQAGVILFKDASTNKGGVTASSLEVLAGLSMNDGEYADLMCALGGGDPPSFYKRYLDNTVHCIKKNARAEFECLWREYNQRAGAVSRSSLTTQLSAKINELTSTIERSQTHIHNPELFKRVLLHALPALLVESLGIDLIMQRVPKEYLLAMFSKYIAANYVYTQGINDAEFKFYQYMEQFNKQE